MKHLLLNSLQNYDLCGPHCFFRMFCWYPAVELSTLWRKILAGISPRKTGFGVLKGEKFPKKSSANHPNMVDPNHVFVGRKKKDGNSNEKWRKGRVGYMRDSMKLRWKLVQQIVVRKDSEREHYNLNTKQITWFSGVNLKSKKKNRQEKSALQLL